jgi:hypothetical protein
VNSYKLEFPSERYVNAILSLGSSQEQYQKSKGVKIILDNKDGIPIKTYDFSSDLSAYGQEIVVQAYCKTIRVQALNDEVLLRYLAVFTTPTSCQEPFEWTPDLSPGSYALKF